jgi:hypothetical protein
MIFMTTVLGYQVSLTFLISVGFRTCRDGMVRCMASYPAHYIDEKGQVTKDEELDGADSEEFLQPGMLAAYRFCKTWYKSNVGVPRADKDKEG